MKRRLVSSLALLATTALIAVGAPLACSAVNNPGSNFNTGGAGGEAAATSSAGEGAGGGGDLFDGGTNGDSGDDPGECSDAAKLIYVVGTGNELYSFHPPTLTFKHIGILSCPTPDIFTSPFSMAVDRDGMAWVLFNDGAIYKVDTANAACSKTAFVPNQVAGFNLFGMGFVSDTPGSTEETLYLGSYDGTGIAKIDLATLKVIPIGNYDKISGAAEMTGTGDARLFGFFSSASVTVAEIDKSNGHILSMAPQPTVNIGAGWAFAFWGGDFYLFTDPSGFGSSQVDRYRPSDGTTVTVKTDVGFTIVGAGVSTCAPITPPN